MVQKDANRRGYYSIGQLAELTGVTPRTIRYYEQCGILPPPERSAGQTRRYTPEYVDYLDTVIAQRDLGFTVTELALLSKLILNVGGPMTADERAEAGEVIANRLETIEKRITTLRRLKALLKHASTGAPIPAAATAGAGASAGTED